jgi:hypothetical protein
MDRQRGIGIVLVALGVLFLVGRFVDLGATLWPFFVLAPGIALLAWAFMGGRSSTGLAVPGSIVTTVGLILFAQNATGRFDTWSYAWGLIVASVGVGTWLFGVLSDREKETQEGIRTFTVGLVLFAAFGVFFEFVIGLGGRPGWLGTWVVPLLLIAGGVALLYRRPAA